MWRRVPPVYSPVRPAALTRALLPVAGGDERGAVADALASVHGARDVILTDSGTSALTLALRMSVPRGAAVALPGYACLDVVAAAARAGVRVLLYDLDPATLGPDLDSLERVLRRGARAAVIVPLFGYPVDATAVATLLARHGATFIEDAAQASGAMLGGRPVGGFGALSVLSFGRGKGTTAGGGGALLVHDETLTHRVDEMRGALAPAASPPVAALAAQWLLARSSVYALPASVPMLSLGQMVYRAAPEPAAMSPRAARVLRAAIACQADEVRTRRANARVLAAAAEMGRVLTPVAPISEAEPGYLRFAGLTRRRADRDDRLGVVRPYPITLGEHAATREILAGDGDTPGARELRDRLATLPTHSRVTRSDLVQLTSWLAGGA